MGRPFKVAGFLEMVGLAVGVVTAAIVTGFVIIWIDEFFNG